MTHELVCKTTQQGLDPGSRGFCTVGRSAGFPVMLQPALEGISSLATGSRPGSLHMTALQNGERIHVVGRLLAAEADTARRQVELAHYIVPNANELPDAGPAWLASSQLFLAQWNGKARTIDEPVSIPAGTVSGRTATLWKQLTGSSETAKRLAAAVRSSEVVWVVYSSHVPILQLFLEASQLLPTEERWNATFSTDFDTDQFAEFEGLGGGAAGCLWRGVPEGSREIAKLRNLNGARIVNLVQQIREHEGTKLKLRPPEEVTSHVAANASPAPSAPQVEGPDGTRRVSQSQRQIDVSRSSTEADSIRAGAARVRQEASDDGTFRLKPMPVSSEVDPAVFEPAGSVIDDSEMLYERRSDTARDDGAPGSQQRAGQTGPIDDEATSHASLGARESLVSRESTDRGQSDRDIVTPSRAESSRAESSRGESSRGESSRGESARRRARDPEEAVSQATDAMPTRHRSTDRRGTVKPRSKQLSGPRRADADGVEPDDGAGRDGEETELAVAGMSAGDPADSGIPQARSGMQVDVDYRRLAILVAIVLLVAVTVTVVPGLLGDSTEAITRVAPQNAGSTMNPASDEVANQQAAAVEEVAEDFTDRIRRVNELAATIREWDGVETLDVDLRSVQREMLKLATALKQSPLRDDLRSVIDLAEDAGNWLDRVFEAKQALAPATKLAASPPSAVLSTAQIKQTIDQTAAIETDTLPDALQQHISRTLELLASVEGIDGNPGSVVRTVELPRDSTFAIVDPSVPRRSLIDTFELTVTRRAAIEPQQIEENDVADGTEALRRFQVTRGQRQIGELTFRLDEPRAGAAESDGSTVRLELQISDQAQSGDLNRLELTLRGPLFRRVYRLVSESK